MTLRANVEHLVQSGLAVNAHGEDVAANHAAAANRVEAAQSGWQGTSATALTLISERWTTTTSALLARLSDHSQGLHSCALNFSEMEQRHSQALQVPAREADAIANHH